MTYKCVSGLLGMHGVLGRHGGRLHGGGKQGGVHIGAVGIWVSMEVFGGSHGPNQVSAMNRVLCMARWVGLVGVLWGMYFGFGGFLG